MEEVWKPVAGYEGLYEVSNLGNIYSIKLKRNVGYGNKEGYITVSLTKNNERREYLAHRIVAEAFIPNPENKPCVDHVDTNRKNNRVDNLRWCTYAENNANPITRLKSLSEENRKKTSERFKGNQYAKGTKHTDEWKKRMSEMMRGRKITGWKHTEEWKKMMSEKMRGHHHNVSQEIPIIVNGEMYFRSISAACEELGLRESRVAEILKGKTKRHTHKGYSFAYANKLLNK